MSRVHRKKVFVSSHDFEGSRVLSEGVLYGFDSNRTHGYIDFGCGERYRVHLRQVVLATPETTDIYRQFQETKTKQKECYAQLSKLAKALFAVNNVRLNVKGKSNGK